MIVLLRVAAIFLALFALSDLTTARTRRPADSASSSQSAQQAEIRTRLNAWSIGLAGGLLEGAPIRLATEIARVVNDNGQMQVLPIVTRGPTENVNDLLYLRGVDTAIINTDALEE